MAERLDVGLEFNGGKSGRRVVGDLLFAQQPGEELAQRR